jgi:hypothetical protein
MEFQSVFAWKPLLDGESRENLIIDGHRSSASRIHRGDCMTGRSLVQDRSSDACVYTREASAARAALFKRRCGKLGEHLDEKRPTRQCEGLGSWPAALEAAGMVDTLSGNPRNLSGRRQGSAFLIWITANRRSWIAFRRPSRNADTDTQSMNLFSGLLRAAPVLQQDCGHPLPHFP